MPGRLVGETKDITRQPGLLPDAFHARAAYPAREGHFQHLHQPGADRAHGHGVHDSLWQSRGCANWQQQNLAKAHYLAGKLKPRFSGPFFNEFVATLNGKSVEETNKALLKKKIIGGLPLERFYPELAGLRCCCAPPR